MLRAISIAILILLCSALAAVLVCFVALRIVALTVFALSGIRGRGPRAALPDW